MSETLKGRDTLLELDVNGTVLTNFQRNEIGCDGVDWIILA